MVLSQPLLSACQRAALYHVRQRALSNQPQALTRLHALLPDTSWRVALSGIQQRSELVIHFHPDRPTHDGLSVAQALLRDGCYRNQFETGLSNGGLTAFQGGQRDLWEQALFGGAYQQMGVTAAERPIYGSLDLMRHRDGPAPRFGSCQLRLRAEVRERCSLAASDSYLSPTDFATLDVFEGVLAAILEARQQQGHTLGCSLEWPRLMGWLADIPDYQPQRAPGRSLDDYLEAHIHGSIELKRDLASIVADQAFQGTQIEPQLTALAEDCGVPLIWQAGFGLPVDQVPADLRGARMPSLAQRIAPAGWLNAWHIGEAVWQLWRDPTRWADWDTPVETLQHLKYLWHVLVLAGQSQAYPDSA